MGDVALQAIPKGAANLLNTPNVINHLALKGLSMIPGFDQIPELKDLAERFNRNPMMGLMEKAGIVDHTKDPQTGPQRIVDTAIQSAVGALAGPAGKIKDVVRAAGVGLTSGAVGQTTKEFTRDLAGETGSTLLAVAAGALTPLAVSGTGRKVDSFIGTQTKKDLLKEARKEGLVVEPAAVHSGRPTELIESFGGKAPVAQLASIKNQPIINDLAARSIGLPKGTEITTAVLDEVKKTGGLVYKEIADISPRAAKALEELKQVRFDAGDHWKYYNKSGNPEAGKMARKLTAQEGRLEQVIEEEAKKIVDVWTANGSTGRRSSAGSQTSSRTSQSPPTFAGRPGVAPPSPGAPGTTDIANAETLFRTRPRSSEGSTEVGFPTPSGGKGEVGFATPGRERPMYGNETLSPRQGNAGVGARSPSGGSAQPTSQPSSGAGGSSFDFIDLEKVSKTAGDPHILGRLRDSRKLIARAHDIERALIEGPGEVSAAALAAMKRNGKKFTGELDLIARFNQGFGRSSRVASTVPPPSVSGTDAITGMLMGSAGSAAFGPIGATLAAIPLMRKPARELVLSKMFQDHLLKEVPTTPIGRTGMRSAITGSTLFQNNQPPKE